MKTTTKTISLFLILSFLFILPCSALAASKKVELKLWSGWPNMMDPSKPGLQLLQDLINEKGKAANISIKYVGGPEIFGPFQGCESVKAGTVDIAYTAAAYNTGVIPEVDAMKLITTKPWEDRKNGIHELMNQWHNEKGLVFLARAATGQQFQGYLNKEITKPNLKGMTMRVVPIYIPLVKALGAKGVNTAGGEVYTALERKIVDGFWWGGREIRPWGWHEVVKYIWGPPFWILDVYVFMNKAKWDSLDPAQKSLMLDIMKEYEKTAHDEQIKLQSDITKSLLDSGMKEIKFSDADQKWFLNMARTEGWKAAIKKSDRVKQLKVIIEK
jgi:TRAP-type C4-dicarboxylate transport system substrate-binding protein